MAGEGILIVVSILLAFGIDAWWGRRQEDREREALRDGLAAEFISLRGVVTLAVSDADSLERSTRALLEAACRAARDRGAANLFLEVGARNDAAVGLYRSAGFEEVGRRTAYYHHGNGASDAVVMRRILN